MNIFSRLHREGDIGKKAALFHQANLCKNLQIISPLKKDMKNNVLHICLACCNTMQHLEAPSCLAVSSRIFLAGIYLFLEVP